MDAATKAATALQKAQATAIYAGLGLWPKPVMAGLVAGQLAEDGIYPDEKTALSSNVTSDSHIGDLASQSAQPTQDWPGQPRSNLGQYAEGKMGGDPPIVQVAHFWERGKKERKRRRERRLREERRQSHEEQEQEWKTKPHSAPEAKGPEPARQEHGRPPSSSEIIHSKSLFSSVLAPPPPAMFDPAVPASVGPGPFARAAIPAGPSPRPNPSQKIIINEIGKRYGCHTCGIMNPGTDSGNWVGDHQPPTSLTSPDVLQFYLPHCRQCSLRQGGFLRGFLSRGSNQ